MGWSLFLFLGALLAHSTQCLAGAVSSGVLVCGITTHYFRYGSPFPAIIGDSNTGLKSQTFRVHGLLGLEKNESKPSLSKNAALSDFLTAVQLTGVHICVTGNLETKQRTEGPLYYLEPKSFSISESPPLVNPSDLPRTYQVVSEKLDLTLKSENSSEHGLVFYFEELPKLLTKMITRKCQDLESTELLPALLDFAWTRTSKTDLFGNLLLQCSKDQDDLSTVEIEIHGTPGSPEKATGTFKIEGKSYTFEYRNG